MRKPSKKWILPELTSSQLETHMVYSTCNSLFTCKYISTIVYIHMQTTINKVKL